MKKQTRKRMGWGKKLLLAYSIVALLVAVYFFFYIGLHPSSPGCEFFCSPGFGMADLIGSVVLGVFWLPLFLLYAYFWLGGGLV